LYVERGTFPVSDKNDDTVTFEKGWIVVECQGQVRAMQNEYGNGPLLFGKADAADESLHGGCIGNELRGIQASFTSAMSTWDFVNAVTGNPRIFWPAAAGTVDEETVGTPGAIIRVEGVREMDRPFIMPGVSIPPGMESFARMLMGDILGYVSGVREGGLAGGTPANVEAAAAFRILVEQDASRLATTVIGYGTLLQDILRQLVHNIQTFASDQRMYAFIGDDMEPETEEFAGGDLTEDLTYIVVPESIRPQSDAVKRMDAMDMHDRGLATRRDTLVRLGEMEGTDALLEQRLIQHCRREVKQATRDRFISTPLQLMQFEDHELAIDMHRADMFDVRLMNDPEAQALLMINSQIHAWFMGGMMGPFPGDPAMLQGFIPELNPAALFGATPEAQAAMASMMPPPGGPAPPPTQPGPEAGMETSQDGPFV
ncbi:MAG TPA: hypothetical protein VFH61_07660, partial [Thermoleophilia bacterium]|nr:hypothetical protein [Thermoleophilia bacterium]